DGEGDLAGEEEPSDTARPAIRRRAETGTHREGGRPAAARGGKQSEEEAGPETDRGAVERGPDVDPGIGLGRDVAVGDRAEDGGDGDRGDGETDDSGGAGEEKSLDETLPQDPETSGPERDADRDVTIARGGAGEKKICDVRASDPEHERDGAEEDEQG